MTVLLVVLGGAIGAPARYVSDVVVQRLHAVPYPWGTWTVNVAGSFVLGVVAAAGPAWVTTLVGTGFCGALTTFSTFQVQLVELGDDGHVPLAAAYLAVSVACGLLAAAAGAGVARR